MSFSLDIKRFVEKANGNADKVVRKTVLDIGTRLVERTPVGNPEMWMSLNPSYRIMNKAGTKRLKRPVLEFGKQPPPGYVGGHARGNWSHSIGAHVVTEFDIDGRQSGQTAISRIKGSVPLKGSAGLVHYLQNSVPYIQALEDGHSRQAPNGMVGLTAVEFGGIVDEAVRTEVK